MIFIYQLFSISHPLHSKSDRFFQEIANQNMVGITSTLTRTEFIAVIKRELSKQGNAIPAQSTINAITSTFDDFLDGMGIILRDSDDLANIDGRLFTDSHNRVDTSPPTLGADNKWRVLNGADSIHLVFAERCNSQRIATNDDGFKGAASSVQAIILRDAYP